MADSTADGATAPLTVWLPIPAAEIDGLPAGPVYVHWDGEPDFPADPAAAAFYVVALHEAARRSVTRPLPP